MIVALAAWQSHAVYCVDKSSLGILTSSLNDTAAKYYTFGVMLGVSHNNIKAIEKRVVDVKIYLHQILGKWRESENPQLTDIYHKSHSMSNNW